MKPSPHSGIGPGPLLRDLTTMRVGGPVDRLAEPETIEEVVAEVRRARDEDVPLRVLGRGSNLVVGSDGVAGTVLRTHRLDHLRFEAGGRVVAGAGLGTDRLLAATRARGLGGLQCLVGYPATVGGVARMNAGGRWGEVGPRIESVVVVDIDGSVVEVPGQDCGFAYRTSRLGGRVVVEVHFRLPDCDPAEYRAEVTAIHREKAAAQPLDVASAGCVFKNPAGESAGRLVDGAGLLGTSVGDAAVSERHGNFFVNRGHADGDDVLRLIDLVRSEVERRTGVRLELEVEVWRRVSDA